MQGSNKSHKPRRSQSSVSLDEGDNEEGHSLITHRAEPAKRHRHYPERLRRQRIIHSARHTCFSKPSPPPACPARLILVTQDSEHKPLPRCDRSERNKFSPEHRSTKCGSLHCAPHSCSPPGEGIHGR